MNVIVKYGNKINNNYKTMFLKQLIKYTSKSVPF